MYRIVVPDRSAREVLEQRAIPYRAVMAHRGASIVAPESTRPAYERARDLGADYLEADVQRSADGVLIIFHDSDLQRTSNLDDVFPDRRDEPVGSFTFEELRRLDYGSWFNEKSRLHARPEYAGLEILTLRELIQIAREGEHRPGLILESKHPERYPGIERQIIDVLLEEGWLRPGRDGAIYDVGAIYGSYGEANAGKRGDSAGGTARPGKQSPSTGAGDPTEHAEHAGLRASSPRFTRTIFFSFSLESLYAFQELAPEIPRLLLISDNMISRRGWQRWLDWAEPVADGIGIKGFIAWPWHISAAHGRGLFLYPYTINSLWQIRVLAQFQAAGFITDRPEMVLDFFNRLPEQPPVSTDRGPQIPSQAEH
ncbi:MAG: hypothetical protein EA384_05055 [Spirochaetaceae bacterium]|nr:MAG: hypothetical protein EA384_05055 [Spirochaetaceae bacterium]